MQFREMSDDSFLGTEAGIVMIFWNKANAILCFCEFERDVKGGANSSKIKGLRFACHQQNPYFHFSHRSCRFQNQWKNQEQRLGSHIRRKFPIWLKHSGVHKQTYCHGHRLSMCKLEPLRTDTSRETAKVVILSGCTDQIGNWLSCDRVCVLYIGERISHFVVNGYKFVILSMFIAFG